MKKILVIRLSSLGDVVLTLPVFKRLRANDPDAYISALVKEAYADVLKAESIINEIIVFGKSESLFSLIKRIRKTGFDIVIDLHGNLRSRFVSFFSRARRVVRYRKAALARRLFVGWRWRSAELERHTLDRYLETLSRIDPKQGVNLTSPPSKILVIQTAFLGDAVLTTPLLGALREQFPESRLVVLCTPEIAEVFERHPAVSEVILFDKRGKDRSLRSQWQLIGRLKSVAFDLAIIPHRSLTSALLARVAGIPRRIGFSSSQGRWFLTETVPFQWGVHDVDRNLALLKILGVRHPAGDLRIQSDPAAAKAVAERLEAAGLREGETLVGINPGSVWATKRWLPEGFAAVADRLIRDLGAKVLFLGGPKDRDVMSQILQSMTKRPVNWVGETTLPELIAAIARCQAFLTNDSGPMHIAVARRVPTVALFGPTTQELGFFPYGSGHLVVEKDLPCRPCGLHGADACPLGHFQCMKLITSEEVFEAVKRQLAHSMPSSPAGVSGGSMSHDGSRLTSHSYELIGGDSPPDTRGTTCRDDDHQDLR